MGQVRDLPKSELGVDEKTFEPTYEVLEGKEKVVSELKAAAKKADAVFIASDPDREGEAIGWHVMNLLGGESKKVRRILFHEITKNAVLKAINNPTMIDMNKVNAQQARRVLDRLVGYKLSPLLWDKCAICPRASSASTRKPSSRPTKSWKEKRRWSAS